MGCGTNLSPRGRFVFEKDVPKVSPRDAFETRDALRLDQDLALAILNGVDGCLISSSKVLVAFRSIPGNCLVGLINYRLANLRTIN